MAKIIGLVPFKNEDWILGYTLSCLSTFCDEIIVLDDGSDDRSLEICKSFAKVTEVIKKENRRTIFRNEPRDWNLLTKAGLRHGADWLFYTDADEMVSKDIFDLVGRLDSLGNVGCVQFKKVALWRSFERIRSGSDKWVAPPENVLNPILLRACNSIFWSNPKGNFFKRIAKWILRGERFKPIYGRVFPKGIKGDVLRSTSIVAVHFNNLSYSVLIKKQLNYALNQQLERPYLSVEAILNWSYSRLDESGLILEDVQDGWIWDEYRDLIRRNCD